MTAKNFCMSLRLCYQRLVPSRKYCAGLVSDENAVMLRRICKTMMSCPKLELEATLDHSGINLSAEIVEGVLKRSENAGMLSYQFFEWAGKQRDYEHSVKAYHAIIRSLTKVRQYEIIWGIVDTMRSKGVLQVETFCIIMSKYAISQRVEECLNTFNVMEKYRVPQNLAAFNGLLSALCKSKNVRKAQEMFDKMKDQFVPDSKTYSILIEGWGKAPNLPRSKLVYREMVDAGCAPDIVTYGIMVDILCKADRVDEAVEIVKKMPQDCKPTSFIYSILVHTYGKENRIEDVVETFQEMERTGIEADVAAHNALIGAFCKVNKFKNVYRVLNEMEGKGVTPSSRTINIILTSLIANGKTDEAFTVFRQMVKICDADADTYTIMVKMFCQKDDIDTALKIWKYMRKNHIVPGVHTSTVLINGLCRNGNISKACVLLEEMVERGISTSSVTFGKLRQLLLKQGREDVVEFLQQKIDLLVKEPFV